MGNVKMMKEEMRMLFENMDRFEEIPEVYGVFPLKEDYLEAGNKALEQYGVQAEVEDNVIRIPFADRLLFSEDEYSLYGVDDDDNADMREWRMEVTACISLNGDLDEGIREVWCEYRVVLPEDEDNDEFDEYYEPRNEEYEKGYDLIEAFLNRAVDAA